jgi:hypothetical protein
VKLCEVDHARTGLEIGDDGRRFVGWNGRPAKPNPGSAGASLTCQHTLTDHLAFKFREHTRHLQQRLADCAAGPISEIANRSDQSSGAPLA